MSTPDNCKIVHLRLTEEQLKHMQPNNKIKGKSLNDNIRYLINKDIEDEQSWWEERK